MIDPNKNMIIEKKVEHLLSKMTLQEKIGQMVQLAKLSEKEEKLLEEGRIGSFLNLWGHKNINKAQKIATEHSRLGIPVLIGDDVIHGFSTIFPIPLAESCSWDLEKIQRSAHVSALEATANGIRWTFAPMVDIARDPRWGRIAEGAGEDPYLGSEVAKARVRGFQSPGNGYDQMLVACAKHFIGYGASEGGRDYNSCDFSEHTLRTTYLPPFQAAVEEGVGTVMSSFNDVMAVPASVNSYLCDTILKEQLGFDGFIVSDWESIEEVIAHRVASDRKDAAKKGLLGSIDMDMHSDIYLEYLEELVEEEPELIERINDSVRRILRVKMQLGLFENPYVDENLEKYILSKENRDVARDVAKSSIVLLKNNNNVLPLSKDTKIALIGPLADNQEDHLGCWAWKGNPNNVVSIYEAMKNRIPGNTNYAKGCSIDKRDKDGFKEAYNIAEKSDVIVLCVGESRYMSGENFNRSTLNLPGIQSELFDFLLKTGKPIVVVLTNGRPLAIPEIDANADAILETWALGVEAGNAICDVLFSDYNPSGKLTTTFPRSVGQIPIYYNHKSTGRPLFPNYIDELPTPLYPFGYGLSYSKFKYSNLRLEKDTISTEEDLSVFIDIENISDRDGEEIVQVYYCDLVASVTKPVKELCTFEKRLILSGEKTTIQLNIPAKRFGLINRNMEYVIEPGKFALWVGPNSVDGHATQFEILAQ